MIGISVSFCVIEIVEGKVSIDDVEKIVGGTYCTNARAFEILIKQYRKTYWKDFPDEAEKIFRQLLSAGKIEQPRIKNTNHFPVLGKINGQWVESEDKIPWHDQTE